MLVQDSEFLENDADCIDPPFWVENIYHDFTLLLLFLSGWLEHFLFERGGFEGKHKALQLFLVNVDDVHTLIKCLFPSIMPDPSPGRKY